MEIPLYPARVKILLTPPDFRVAGGDYSERFWTLNGSRKTPASDIYTPNPFLETILICIV